MHFWDILVTWLKLFLTHFLLITLDNRQLVLYFNKTNAVILFRRPPNETIDFLLQKQTFKDSNIFINISKRHNLLHLKGKRAIVLKIIIIDGSRITLEKTYIGHISARCEIKLLDFAIIVYDLMTPFVFGSLAVDAGGWSVRVLSLAVYLASLLWLQVSYSREWYGLK